jgi:hypothetical protein
MSANFTLGIVDPPPSIYVTTGHRFSGGSTFAPNLAYLQSAAIPAAALFVLGFLSLLGYHLFLISRCCRSDKSAKLRDKVITEEQFKSEATSWQYAVFAFGVLVVLFDCLIFYGNSFFDSSVKVRQRVYAHLRMFNDRLIE